MSKKNKLMMMLIAGVLGISTILHGGYWDWGWGSYGVGSVEDVARFDWSCVNFGNVPESQVTIDRCNAILKLNPNHKFLLRLWPVGGGGSVFRNVSVFDYHYGQGYRERVLARIESQVKLIRDNISDPRAICALTFCEELPGHVSSFSIMRRAGQKDKFIGFKEMAPYREQVQKELGAEFDPKREEHMRFWGKKFVSMLDEAHRLMKKLCPSAKVIYWQATAHRTIDMVDKYQHGVLPFKLSDILGPDRCDGIFAYPNNQRIWERQTIEPIKKYDCVMFSQISTPSYMRLEQFDKTVETARWKNPNNLGTFLYSGYEPRPNAFNAIKESKNTSKWRNLNYQNRWFGWKHKIGLDIVNKALTPQVSFVYDFTDKVPGEIVNISVQALNRRDASWFGGDATLAEIDLTTELILPDCLKLAAENSFPLKVSVGKMSGEAVKVVNTWQVQVVTPIPENLTLRAQVLGKNIPSVVETSAVGVRSMPNIFLPWRLSKQYAKWLVPYCPDPVTLGGLEIQPLNVALMSPGIRTGGQECIYQGKLEADEILKISGEQAKIIPGPLFNEKVLNFKRFQDEQPRVFKEGYLLFSTPRVPFLGGDEYTMTLNGKCDKGAIAHVLAEFTGKKDGKAFKKYQDVIYSSLKKGVATKTFKTPEYGEDPGTGRVCFRFYRAKKQGELTLDSFMVRRKDGGKDVSSLLKGKLPSLVTPSYWEYFDSNPFPNRYNPLVAPIVSVRFLPPGE